MSKILLLALLTFGIVYLMASFVALDFNIANWSKDGRFAYILSSCGIYAYVLVTNKQGETK